MTSTVPAAFCAYATLRGFSAMASAARFSMAVQFLPDQIERRHPGAAHADDIGQRQVGRSVSKCHAARRQNITPRNGAADSARIPDAAGLLGGKQLESLDIPCRQPPSVR